MIGKEKVVGSEGEALARQRELEIPSSTGTKGIAASDLEVDHVFRVYDNISVHWNHTRGKRKVHWPRIKTFIESLPKGALVADIGSGDGKYFGINPGIFSIGCDRSLRLLEVSRSPEFETFCCDAVKLPLVSDMFDASLCIAVMHHLASTERRLAVIQELLRITCPGGFVMIHAWAQEQGDDSRHEFPEQDMLVPWRLQKRFFLPGQSGSGISPSSSSGIGAEGVGQGQGLPGDERASAGMTVATTKKLPSKSTLDGNGSSSGFQPKKQRRKKKSKRPLVPRAEGDIDTSAGNGQIGETVTEAKIMSDPLSDGDGDGSESVDPAAAATDDEETETATKDIDGNGGGGLCASVQGLELSVPVPVQSPTDGVIEAETVEQQQQSSSSSADPSVSSVVAALSTVSPDGPCEHMVEDEQKGQLIFQRYCHVYKEGELEELCQSVPGCEIVETGWDKGNWTVLLHKTINV